MSIVVIRLIALFTSLVLGGLTLSACDRVEERKARLNTLIDASKQQISDTLDRKPSGNLIADPIRERSIHAPVLVPEDRDLQRQTFWILADSLILTPVDITEEAEQETSAPLPPDPDLLLSGLKSYGLTIEVTELSGGSLRLNFQRENTDERPFHQRILELKDSLPDCEAQSGILPGSQHSDEKFLSCLMAYLETSGAFSAVSPDVLLQPATPSASKPASPVATSAWSYTPSPVTLSSDLGIAFMDTGLVETRGVSASGVDFVSDPAQAGDGSGRDGIPTDPGDQCDPDNVLQQNSQHGTNSARLFSKDFLPEQNAFQSMTSGGDIKTVRISGRCGARLSDLTDAIYWVAGLTGQSTENAAPIWNTPASSFAYLPFAGYGACPQVLQTALDNAAGVGVIFIVPAGNNGASADAYFPANCRQVITVAASDRTGELTAYSNYGQSIDVLAPGGDLAADLDQDGWPDGMIIPQSASDCRDPITNAQVENCHLLMKEGTSLAALHVLAKLAQLRTEHPEYTRQELLMSFFEDLSPVSQSACRGPCPDTPGGSPITDMPGQCHRACGAGQITASQPLTLPAGVN